MESNDSPESPDRGRHQTSTASLQGVLFNIHTNFELYYKHLNRYTTVNCLSSCEHENSQGQSNWHEWVKLHKYDHYAKFDTIYIYSVKKKKKLQLKFLAMPGWPDYLTLIIITQV